MPSMRRLAPSNQALVNDYLALVDFKGRYNQLYLSGSRGHSSHSHGNENNLPDAAA